MPRTITEMYKSVVSKVQTAYKKQVRLAEARAKLRMKSAKTRYEKERVKAELEREKLVLQRQMYEAKEQVLKEKRAVVEARHRAGVRTWGERAEGAGKDLWKAGSKLVSGKPKPKRGTAKRKATRRRS